MKGKLRNRRVLLLCVSAVVAIPALSGWCFRHVHETASGAEGTADPCPNQEEQRKIVIVEAGAYIVPGSTWNCIRYNWTGYDTPSSVRLDVRANNGVIVRTINNLPTTYVAGQTYAERCWNGCKDEAGANPLLESESPYTLQMTGVWSTESCFDQRNANVEEWLLDIGINDGQGEGDAIVTGPDEDTVNSATLRLEIQVAGGSLVSPGFAVTPDEEVEGGPQGNDHGYGVTPAFVFYTTPTAPYDIRYSLVAQQLTTVSEDDNERRMQTIMDCTLNPWDMDPNQEGRQTRATWSFGIDNVSGTAVRRGLQESYQ